MQTQPPPGYQPGGWQQQDPYQHPLPQPPQSPRTQTLNLEYNVAAGLCYIPFFFIHFILPAIFLSTEPKTNRFVRFHALQGLLLGISTIVGGVGAYVLVILGVVFSALLAAALQSPAAVILAVVFVGLFVALLGGFALFMFVSTIIACIKAFSGETWRVPLIGKLAERYS
jgi:uncharacterized membrane protein